MPNLRQWIVSDGQVHSTRDDQNVPIGQRSVGGIPPAQVHRRLPCPGFGDRVIDRGVAQSNQVLNVASGNEEPPVR